MRITLRIIEEKGGKGSGHRSHHGRIGKRGGSVPGVGLATVRDREKQKLHVRFVHKYRGKLENLRKPPETGAYRSDLADIKGNGKVILKYTQTKNLRKERDGVNTTKADYRSDVETFRAAEMMGFNDLVPYTERVNNPETGEKCAAMEWISGDIKEIHSSRGKFKNGSVDQFSQVAVLDTITGNRDRHGGNLLVDQKTGRIHAIDNSLGFHRNLEWHPSGLDRAVQHYKYMTGKSDFQVLWRHIAAGDRLVNNATWRRRITQKFDQGALDRIDKRWAEFKKVATNQGWWNQAHESDMLHERGQV